MVCRVLRAVLVCLTASISVALANFDAGAQLRRPHLFGDTATTPAEPESDRIDITLNWMRFSADGLVSYAYNEVDQVVVDGVELPLQELGARTAIACDISGVVAIGYASSAGRAAYNDRLAADRTRALLDAAQDWYLRACGQPLPGWRVAINRGEARGSNDDPSQRPVTLLSLKVRSEQHGLLRGETLVRWAEQGGRPSTQVFEALYAARGRPHAGPVTGYAQCRVLADTASRSGSQLCDLLIAADSELEIF